MQGCGSRCLAEDTAGQGGVLTRRAIEKDPSRCQQTQALEGSRVLDWPLECLPQPALHILISTNIAPCYCTKAQTCSITAGLPH